jgi:ATP-dependent Clp endopeptidase proteolytic subunit ClpP
MKISKSKTLSSEEEKTEEEESQVMLIVPGKPEPDLRIIGLFTDITEDKLADLVQGFYYLNEVNVLEEDEEEKKPIEFIISTYGGSADAMMTLYDIMRLVMNDTEIHTFGVGKVMSAGVLLLAAGTKGKRKISKNCRVMIHSVIGANHGELHNLVNEMEEIQKLQETYSTCLIKETKITKRQLKKMLERKVNVYLTAERAVELGIADIIV